MMRPVRSHYEGLSLSGLGGVPKNAGPALAKSPELLEHVFWGGCFRALEAPQTEVSTIIKARKGGLVAPSTGWIPEGQRHTN